MLQLELDGDARDPLSLPTLLVGRRWPTPRTRCGGCRPSAPQRERLAIEAERQPDRVGAARLRQAAAARGAPARHLAVRAGSASRWSGSSRAPTVELESAASDMDTSLAELRSPLEGRRLDVALRERADELDRGRRPPRSTVDRPRARAAAAGRRARLPDRLRGADQRAAPRRRDDRSPSTSTPTRNALRLRIADDGRGLPDERRPGANGLFAMESRAATIGATLTFSAADGERGTAIELARPPRPRTEHPHDPRRRHR